MVAEAGEPQVEYTPNVGGETLEKKNSDRLNAKRAAILARKNSRVSSSETSSKQSHTTTRTDDVAEEKDGKKKKKKFKPAPWLCEGMEVLSSALIRSDVDDATATSEGRKPQMGIQYDDSETGEIDELEPDMLYRRRLKGKTRLSGEVRNVPNLNYATRRKLEDAIIKPAKKNLVNSNVLSRLKAHDDEITYAKERRNDNTAWILNNRGLRKRNDVNVEPKKVEEYKEPEKTKPNYTRTKRCKRDRNYPPARKPRWTQQQREQQVYIPHEFELVTENVDHDDPEESNLLCFLLDLQHREMTPEDYDMLLRLDDKVAPKTINSDKLDSLRTETVPDITGDDANSGPMEGMRWADVVCAVCMDPYEKGQTVKFLPCEHVFHSDCIDMWLKNSGNTCPLDGLQV